VDCDGRGINYRERIPQSKKMGMLIFIDVGSDVSMLMSI
jgi:hypothetical protein